MFITLGRLPDHPNPNPGAIARAAQLAGLALSDGARLLMGTFPRILLRVAADPDALVAAFAAEGFIAWASDPAQVPTDGRRVIGCKTTRRRLAVNTQMQQPGLAGKSGQNPIDVGHAAVNLPGHIIRINHLGLFVQ